MSAERIPVACSLTTSAAEEQLAEWSRLRRSATAVERLDKGVRIVAPVEFAEHAHDLAEREATCCSFLDIHTAVDDASVVVTITSANPDAGPVIELLAGSA